MYTYKALPVQTGEKTNKKRHLTVHYSKFSPQHK